MATNPYAEMVIDEASGHEFLNPEYMAWQTGYAAAKAEDAEDIRVAQAVREADMYREAGAPLPGGDDDN